MSWWRNRAKEQRLEHEAQALIHLVREEQRLNRTLVTVVEQQNLLIKQLLDEKVRRYPATTGIQVSPG